MSYKWADLATFNAERSRGIIHTSEWVAKMAERQRQFDDERNDLFASQMRWRERFGGGWV